MITRRRFTALAGSAATALMAAPHVARGQTLPVVRLGNAAGIIDTQVIFLTMGQHPRLKYYEQEGCRMEILNLSGVGQSAPKICGRRPSDAHHLRFAQHPALGRKVSDEFTVPLCRTHHRQLHRAGEEEAAWWTGQKIDAINKAALLWQQTRAGR